MELGMIGLGRMGANMAERLVRGGHRVVGFDPKKGARTLLEGQGAGLGGFAAGAGGQEQLAQRRIVWLMVPAGDITDKSLDALVPLLKAGDTVIDGGNSNYKDTMRRAKALAPRAFNYVDAGTSGGVWGLKNGYSMMVGGDAAVVERLRPIFETLAPAPKQGWAHVRARRRRPLHQDDPQRHRIRHDAGLCRRLLDPAAQEGSSASTCTRSPRSGATAAWCAPGCSTSRRRP